MTETIRLLSLNDLPRQIKVPENKGYITKVAVPDATAKGVVICLSDLHGHIGVQLNLAKIIEHLATSYGFDLLCVEGATGPADFYPAASLPYRNRLDYAERLLKRGYLVGAEYLMITQPHLAIEMWGIDDKDLYLRQHSALCNNIEISKSVVETITRFRAKLLQLSKSYISPAIAECMRVMSEYESGQTETNDYVKKLFRYYALTPAARRRVLHPDIQKQFEEWRKGSYDIAQPQTKGDQAIEQWLCELPSDVLQACQTWQGWAQQFPPARHLINKRLGAPGFNYNQLLPRHPRAFEDWLNTQLPEVQKTLCVLIDQLPIDQLRKWEDWIGCLPAEVLQSLNDWVSRVPSGVLRELQMSLDNTQRSGRPSILIGEGKSFLWSIALGLCSTDFDEHFLTLLQLTDQLLSFFEIRATPDVAHRFLTKRTKVCLSLQSDVARINEYLAEAGERDRLRVGPLLEAITIHWQHSEIFYLTARQRSTTMAIAVAREMKRRNSERAMVITGGFHTRDVAEHLRIMHMMGTVIITPDVDELPPDLHERYRNFILKRAKHERDDNSPLPSLW